MTRNAVELVSCIRIAVVLGLVCARLLHAQTQPIQYYYDDLGRLVTMVNQSGNVATYFSTRWGEPWATNIDQR